MSSSHVQLPREHVCGLANKALQEIEDRRKKEDKKSVAEWIAARKKYNAFWRKATFGLCGNKEPTEEEAQAAMKGNLNYLFEFPSIWGHHTEGTCNQLIAACSLSGDAEHIAVSTLDLTLLSNVLR
jgi:hypothetical protein